VSIEWFRDLSLCILGMGATVVIILIGVVVLLLYIKLRPILNSLRTTTKTVEDISSCMEEEVVRPLAQVAAFTQGLSQVVGLIRRYSKRKEGGQNG
jgi:hypothetical protein